MAANALKAYRPTSHVGSCKATTAMPISHEMTNARDIRRDGHGRQHHAIDQNIVRTANDATTTCDARPSELTQGSRTAREITTVIPLPTPIITRIASAIERLAKYCTCAA